MIPLGLFTSRTFSGANLLTFGLYGALSAGTFFLSLNLVQAQGYPMAVAGLRVHPLRADPHGPVPLGRRAGGQGGAAAPADHRPGDCGRRVPLHGVQRAFGRAVALLGDILPRRGAPGHRHGNHRCAAHHGRDELRGHALCGHRIGNQQCRFAHRGRPGHRRGRRVAPCSFPHALQARTAPIASRRPPRGRRFPRKLAVSAPPRSAAGGAADKTRTCRPQSGSRLSTRSAWSC